MPLKGGHTDDHRHTQSALGEAARSPGPTRTRSESAAFARQSATVSGGPAGPLPSTFSRTLLMLKGPVGEDEV